jgi:hypothetical protein
MAKATNDSALQSQSDKFKEAAREVETDDDEKRFDERLKRVAKAEQKNGRGKTQ